MKKLLLIFTILLTNLIFAQTTTTTSGNFSTTSNWTAGVPGNGDDAIINLDMTVDQNLLVQNGTWNIDAELSGLNFNLDIKTGGTFDVDANVYLEGTMNVSSGGILTIRNGDTLEIGTSTWDNGSVITIESGGVLIVNGNLTNQNNSDNITIDGEIIVNGDVYGGQGSSISGSGSISATGTITTDGTGDIFGSTDDCNTGPCNTSCSGTILSTQQSGDWLVASTWECNRLPTSTDIVSIEHPVTNGQGEVLELQLNGDLTLSDTLLINDNVTTTSGTLTSNGFLFITNTAYVDGPSRISGDVIVEVSVNKGATYTYYSSPVSGDDVNSIKGTNVFLHDETKTSILTAIERWSPYNGTLNDAIGYISMYKDIAYFKGSLHSGDYSPTLTHTPITGWSNDSIGWNLIGNPYANDIDWDLITMSNVLNTVYVWNGANYITWNGSVGSLTDGIIPKGQGFFIQAQNNSASITLSESSQANQSQGIYRLAYLPIITFNVDDGWDKAYVVISDDNNDSPKLKGSGAQIYIKDIKNYTAKYLDINDEINLVVEVNDNKSHNINVESDYILVDENNNIFNSASVSKTTSFKLRIGLITNINEKDNITGYIKAYNMMGEMIYQGDYSGLPKNTLLVIEKNNERYKVLIK